MVADLTVIHKQNEMKISWQTATNCSMYSATPQVGSVSYVSFAPATTIASTVIYENGFLLHSFWVTDYYLEVVGMSELEQ